MYAIIEAGGQQHRVTAGDLIKVQKMGTEAGKEVKIEKVLLVEKDGEVHCGRPFLDKASVTAEVQGDGRYAKVLIFKKKPRKCHKKFNGHRQHFTTIRIKDIVFGG